MKTRRRIVSILCCMAGIAATATAQQGQQASPAKLNATGAQSEAVLKFAREGADVVVGNPSRDDRSVPVIPGGACQQSGFAGSSGASQFAALNQFRPTTAGTVTQVNWAAVYRQGLGTAASPFANATPPQASGAETFLINFYTHNPVTRLPNGNANGLGFDAGTVAGAGTPAFTATVNPTRTPDTAPATLTIGGVVYTLYNYTVTLPSGFAVNTSTCYWIQIQNISPGYDLGFTSTGLQWRWARSSTGNGSSIQKNNQGNAESFAGADVNGLNYAFCINVPFDTATPCNTYPACTQATANCQNYGSGTDNLISAGATGARVADNFRVATAGSLTGLCFTGFYGGQIRPPADESFTVNIYSSNTVVASGQPGPFNFPTTLIASTTLSNDGAPTSQPYTSRAARFNTATATGPTGGLGFANFYEWTATFNTPIALGVGCYWIEIVGNSATNWAWLSNSSLPAFPGVVVNGGDGFSVQRANQTTPYDASSQVRAADRAFCLSFAINPIGSACPPGPAATNATCNGAVSLPLTGVAQLGFVLSTGGGGLLPPSFGAPIDSTEGGVWYTFTSATNQSVTITTCNTAATSPGGGVPISTNYDTRLQVYCASTCAGPFKAVAYNNDATAAACTLNAGAAAVGASTVTFPAVAGQVYYVFVVGDAGDTGFHYISATTAALGTIQPVACANINEPPCVLPNPPTPGPLAFVETEACGTNTLANTCQVAYALNYGQTAYGTTFTTGTARDRDFYKLPDQTVAGTVSIDVRVATEAPVNVFVVTNGAATCPAGTADPSFTNATGFTIFPGCTTTNVSFQVDAAQGQVFVLVLPTAFDGLPCSLNRSKYVLRVDISPTGACCSANGCTITTREDCADPAGTNGQFDGSAACNASCDPVNGGTTLPVGACCTTDGGCGITIQAGCSGANVWVAGQTACLATSCTTAPFGQCCNAANGACALLTQQGCDAIGGVFSATTGCLPNSCPLPPPTGSCCNPNTGGCTAGLTQAQCTTGGGTNWTAAGTCSPNTCPAPSGACCNSGDGTCSVQAGAAACTGLGATFSYSGNNTVCVPNTCPPPAGGRCCVGSRCVTNVANAAACNALIGGSAGASFTAGATNCNAPGTFTSPCCFADYNKSGSISVQDIFDFLNGWFSNSINADINNSGAISVQDIFDFLSAWFAGGC